MQSGEHGDSLGCKVITDCLIMRRRDNRVLVCFLLLSGIFTLLGLKGLFNVMKISSSLYKVGGPKGWGLGALKGKVGKKTLGMQ